jgi:cyclic beta-1,2-glucan synthetase
MDFETRDRYRKQVEELSFEAGVDELKVAREAVRLAQSDLDRREPGSDHRGALAPENTAEQLQKQSTQVGDDSGGNGRNAARVEPWDHFQTRRAAHIGYYLLDRGRQDLEQHLGYRPGGRKRLAHWVFAHPALVYLGGIALLAGGLTALFIAYTLFSMGSPIQALAAGLLALIPAMTIAVYLVNWIISKNIPPQVLPKMDFEKGMPADCSTLVIIPALLSSVGEVESLLRQIEQHFLRNPEPHISFALLTDFVDAAEQRLAEDEQVVAAAVQGIQALNVRYKRESGGPFLLLHRERRWNPSEGLWMGWERKRGKLHELNRLVLGDPTDSFASQAGDLSILPTVRYIITLDADTILPREAASRLVSALAHPLNRVEFGPDGRVAAGYTILQPRTEITNIRRPSGSPACLPVIAA